MDIKKNHSYIDHVMSLTAGGMKGGRDNIIQLLAHLGSPQDTMQVFHVTGSNGKGSVCQMIAQVLNKQFKKKVGLFTSPHLIDINERFQINGVPIPYSKLNQYYKKVCDLGRKYTIELSFFEIQVMVMVLYFTDEKVEYAVIEVGLGGLYDGTNIFKEPLACFVTSIALEHTHILGKTRKSILKNKLGIVKPHTRLYTPIKNKQVRLYCEQYGVDYTYIDDYSGEIVTNLPGKHQQRNAFLVLKSLSDIGYEKADILKGLKNIYNPGRFEYIQPHILVDTANNEENIKILKKMMKKDFSQATIIFGTTQIDSLYIGRIMKLFDEHKKILVDGFCERALPVSTYNTLIPNASVWHLNTAQGKKNIEKILHLGGKNQKYVIFGSLYLVGYVMKLSRYNIFAKQ